VEKSITLNASRAEKISVQITQQDLGYAIKGSSRGNVWQSGYDWPYMLSAISTNSKVHIDGAIDAEVGYSGPTNTLGWQGQFQNADTSLGYSLYDYGDVASGTVTDNGWTAADKWNMCYSGSDFPFAESFSTGQAKAWGEINNWGITNKGYSMLFMGVLDESPSSPYLPETGTGSSYATLLQYVTSQSSVEYYSNI